MTMKTCMPTACRSVSSWLDRLPDLRAKALNYSPSQSPLVRADAHRRLHRMIPDEQLGQRQGVALSAIGDIDAADLVAQMTGFRDEIPQEVLDPLGPLVGDAPVDLKHVHGLAVAVAREFETKPGIARPIQQG